MSDRLRVAAIITIYHPKSHADVIVTKFLKGMSTDEGFLAPEIEIVSIYLDHALENDIGLGLAEEFGVPIYPSIRRALHAVAHFESKVLLEFLRDPTLTVQLDDQIDRGSLVGA